MSATASDAASAARSVLARWQFWIVLALAGVVAAAGMQLLDGDDAEPYGLDSTNLDGYAALASVLEDEGVQIHRAYSAQVAADLMQEHGEAPVVVLARGFQPQPQFVAELSQQHQQGRDVLWMSDSASVLAEALGDELQTGPAIPTAAAGTPTTLEASQVCGVEAASSAERLRAPGGSLQTEAGCFPVEPPADDSAEGYALAQTSSGWAFTAPDAFTNQHITEAGNAALALGLLGADATSDDVDLIWYTPTGADATGAQQWSSPLDHLPQWFWPLAWWLLLCGVLAMLVAGRRFGPVVSEPLPVSVPASESAHGRGRLYQRSNEVAATARTLRSAHLLRLGRLLRLGPAPDAEVIAEAVARESGWEDQKVTELLISPEVGTNAQLSSYAQQLAQLENDVRDATRMRRRP